MSVLCHAEDAGNARMVAESYHTLQGFGDTPVGAAIPPSGVFLAVVWLV